MKNIPPKRILVPLDPSRVSRAAWMEARALAQRLGGDLDAVYIWDWMPRSFDEIPRPLDAADERKLQEELGAKLAGSPAVRVAEGDPLSTILASAAEFDLIVMGTHGRTKLGSLALGSMAEAVVRASPTPVLVVPRKAPPPGLAAGPGAFLAGPVLAPVSFAPHSLETFRYAARLAAALSAPLTVLRAEGPDAPPDFRRRFEDFVAALPAAWRAACLATLKVSRKPPLEAILEEAQSHSLIVLASHRKSFLGDMVLGTTAERVLRRSPIPVLAVPAKEPD